ncbi:hypothetical protein LCGC14_2954320, partial [marine sediment metagenome]
MAVKPLRVFGSILIQLTRAILAVPGARRVVEPLRVFIFADSPIAFAATIALLR